MNNLFCSIVDAVFVGGVLLPHGDFALDPSFFRNGTVERNAADNVAMGARQAGRWLVRQHKKCSNLFPTYVDCNVTEEEPMIILMTTPHGIKLDYDYGIYVSSKGSGTATIGGDCTGFQDTQGYLSKNEARDLRGISKWSSNAMKNGQHHCQHKPYNVTLQNIDLAPTDLANDLVEILKENKRHPVSAVYSYADDTPIPLNWGEIVPLLLLPTVQPSADLSPFSASTSPILPLIWTFPHRRYNHSVDMVPELLQVGADIMEWAKQRPEKIGIIVSGDLSHTHESSGPYGYSAASGPYDNAIGQWAGGHRNGIGTRRRTRRNWDPCQPEAKAALLNRAKELQPDAKSCGFTGYVMWHGMMCQPASSAPVLPRLSPMMRDSSTNKKNTSSSINNKTKDRKIKFKSEVFVNQNVTYYGMIAAIFEASFEGEDSVGKNSN